MAVTDSISIGSPPWSEFGPDLAFLRLPASVIGDIDRLATIVNGDRHRQNIISGEPTPTRTFCAVAGVIDEMTKPLPIVQIPNGTITSTSFEALINVGHVFQDDQDADRFRFQPIASGGNVFPASYKGTSGGGLWLFFLDLTDFAIVQVRLVGVVYWEKQMDDELHLIGHGQSCIYETLFNAIRQRWS